MPTNTEIFNQHRHSLLLITTDDISGQTVEVLPCDGIDGVIDEIAIRCTHPEEDPRVSYEIVGDAWNEHVAMGSTLREFVRHTPRHTPRPLTFTVFPIDKLGAVER